MAKRFCDEDCNNCPIIGHANSRQLTVLMNDLLHTFGDDAEAIISNRCPNLTCCADCHIDDFCHSPDCELEREATK